MALQYALVEDDRGDRPRPPWGWTLDVSWTAKAKCRGSASLFFASDRERPARRERREATARALCESCPVLEPCRAWARANREYGYWGGESEEERAEAGYRPTLTAGLTPRRRVS